ncbi:GGDEF domain-containing protein [Luteimonas vadosa]|uniref:diguanylate cyclase n=1 Tax=Luteimonas vadosa TaxID=1165507 RepID=A0ABP9EEY1_9GAMM
MTPTRTDGADWLYVVGLVLLLALFAAGMALAFKAAQPEVPVSIQATTADDGTPVDPGAGSQALHVPVHPGGEVMATPLSFKLPPSGESDARWVVWVSRGVADTIALEGADWRSPTRDFFHPAPTAGVLASGYVFPLPGDWSGDVQLRLEMRGAMPGSVRVRVLREGAALRLEQRGAVIAAFIYGSLLMLTLLMLALYSAARDRIFLVFCSANVLALLALAAINGHLYQVPLLRAMAWWRGQGLWALGLLAAGAALQLLSRYASTQERHPRVARWVDGYCLLLGLLAAVCLLGWEGTLQWIVTAGPWLVLFTLGCGVLLAAEAARRRVRLAGPIAITLLLVAVALYGGEIGFFAPGTDPIWLHYGYQMVLVVFAATLAVGMVDRVGVYRNQRDEDRQARADSEMRMRHETARASLSDALQSNLQTLGPGDVEWTALRLLLEHLLPHVPVEFAAAVAHGFQGHDICMVMPRSAQAEVDSLVATRRLQLKREAVKRLSLQQPVTAPDRDGIIATEALVPLPIHAPGWGMLMLRRSGEQRFLDEELALAEEMVRLVMVNVEQALSAINLRRSAELDALTGTFNRRTIDQWLQRCFTDAERNDQAVSVLFVDLDHFKRINDDYGHACGDQCLRRVAATLHQSLSAGDLLGRYGGEEFIVILPGRGGAAARVAGERLRQAIQDLRIECEGRTLEVTVSIGLATRLGPDEKPASTVDRADKALYAAKREGRNCVRVAPAVFEGRTGGTA